MPSSLAPAFLLSMPQLTDPNFSRTVVLLCKHNSEGAFGLVLNRPARDRRAASSSISIRPSKPSANSRSGSAARSSLRAAGFWSASDLDPEEGLRRSAHYATDSACRRRPTCCGACSIPSLPPRTRLIVGYSGWGPGQLEAELAESAWLLSDVDRDLIFQHPARAYVGNSDSPSWRGSRNAADVSGVCIRRLEGSEDGGGRGWRLEGLEALQRRS